MLRDPLRRVQREARQVGARGLAGRKEPGLACPLPPGGSEGRAERSRPGRDFVECRQLRIEQPAFILPLVGPGQLVGAAVRDLAA